MRLPEGYYSDCLLRPIGQAIGRVVKIDANTMCAGWGRFARLGVCVDLRKPLVLKVRINGSIQRVEYEGLPTICFKCGFYRHVYELCTRDTSVPPNTVNPPSYVSPSSGLQHRVEAKQFGPWIMVDH